MADIITTPGKFEGERRYVPTLWSVVLDGGADETIDRGDLESPIAIIILTDEDRQATGAEDYAVALWETEAGFVCAKWFETDDELSRYQRDLERVYIGELR